MSKPTLLKSSSFRLALFLTLVVWVMTSVVLVAIVELAERALLDPATERVTWELDELINIAAEDEEAESFVFNEQMEAYFVETDELSMQSAAAFLSDYRAELAGLREESAGTLRAALDARLWLLGEEVSLSATDRPARFYLDLIFEETPERFHDAFAEEIEERLQDWPDNAGWSARTQEERLTLLLEALLAFEDNEDLCLRIGEDAGGDDWEDAGLQRGDFAAMHVTRSRLLGDEAETCWTRQLRLRQADVAYFGLVITDTYAAVTANRQWRNIGVLGSLALAVLIGTGFGSRVYRRLHRINAITDEVRRGDLQKRIRLSGSGDDFDRLGANINAMLDQIQTLMNGVRQVSDNIAHDLRTPLTRLRNRIEELAQTEQPSRDAVAGIAEQADEVLATFSSLLRIAQLEQGSQRQSFERFDLVQVLSEVCDLYEPVFGEIDVQLATALPQRPVVVSGDRNLWAQAFNNLLENAYKYAHDSARVTVSLREAGRGWQAEVRDQGPGVPEHALPKLIERFFRQSADRQAPGTGLGLSMVAAVAQLHDVALDIQNDGGLVVRLTWQHPLGADDKKARLRG